MDIQDGATIVLSDTEDHGADGAYVCGALADWSEVSGSPPPPGFDRLYLEQVDCNYFGQYATLRHRGVDATIAIRTFQVHGTFGCVPCPVNTYALAEGSEACTPCPPNTVTAETGASDASQCTPCPQGQVVVGDVCLPCEANTYATDGECALCEDNMFSDAGAIACEFRCPRGSFYSSTSGDCVTCPVATFADEGST